MSKSCFVRCRKTARRLYAVHTQLATMQSKRFFHILLVESFPHTKPDTTLVCLSLRLVYRRETACFFTTMGGHFLSYVTQQKRIKLTFPLPRPVSQHNRSDRIYGPGGFVYASIQCPAIAKSFPVRAC